MSIRIRLAVLSALVYLLVAEAPTVDARALTFDERVEAQRAIERVYWSHRIWPKENPGPKPPMSAVLPDEAIRAKVEDDFAKSNALEARWQRSITPAELQAEMDRMAAHTRAPQVLLELFAALGNDPLLIAETLARQTLADLLIRNAYAYDERFHGDLRRTAETALAACGSIDCMRLLGGEYAETTWRRVTGRAEECSPGRNVVSLDAQEWQDHLTRWAEISKNTTGAAQHSGKKIFALDVPTDLGVVGGPVLPGEIVAWDGAKLSVLTSMAGWPISSVPTGIASRGNPGRVSDVGVRVGRSTTVPGNVVVSWTLGCSEGGSDYASYEGTIGSWYSHTRKTCSDTDHDLREEIEPAPGNRYYLVVPLSDQAEGSYGTRSGGVERPRALDACVATQVVTPCPP